MEYYTIKTLDLVLQTAEQYYVFDVGANYTVTSEFENYKKNLLLIHICFVDVFGRLWNNLFNLIKILAKVFKISFSAIKI